MLAVIKLNRTLTIIIFFRTIFSSQSYSVKKYKVMIIFSRWLQMFTRGLATWNYKRGCYPDGYPSSVTQRQENMGGL